MILTPYLIICVQNHLQIIACSGGTSNFERHLETQFHEKAMELFDQQRAAGISAEAAARAAITHSQKLQEDRIINFGARTRRFSNQEPLDLKQHLLLLCHYIIKGLSFSTVCFQMTKAALTSFILLFCLSFYGIANCWIFFPSSQSGAVSDLFSFLLSFLFLVSFPFPSFHTFSHN